MRILDESGDKALNRVTLYFTASEAAELKDSLDALLADRLRQHEHISSDDYRKEVTICIYDVDKLSQFDSRSKKLILEDV